MSTSLDTRPDTEPQSDGCGGVRLDCVGTNTDQTFPPDALENPRTYGAVHQETIDQLRAAQGGGLVQVWCAAPVGAERITPGDWVSLSPQSAPAKAENMQVLTARVDACLLWNDGALEQWRYEGPSVPGVGADSGLEPPHTGAWVLLEADELSDTNHLAVWYPSLERAEWAVSESNYIEALATDTSENWVEISAVETLSLRTGLVTEGHFDLDEPDPALYGTGYDPIEPDSPQAWTKALTAQDRELLHRLADQLNPIAQGLVAAGFAVKGPELEFNPPDYSDGFAQLEASKPGSEFSYVVTALSRRIAAGGVDGEIQYSDSAVIEIYDAETGLITKHSEAAGGVLESIILHDRGHPAPLVLAPGLLSPASQAPSGPSIGL